MLGLQSKMSSPGRISANLTGGGAIENAWKRVERGEREREMMIMCMHATVNCGGHSFIHPPSP